MSERRQSTVDVQVNPSGGSLALIISVIALVFSAVSLYESFFKQPHLHLNIAPTWHYARGEATGDEELIVPLTLTNTGARDATILSIDLTLEKQTGQRVFQSTYRVNDGLSTRAFLTPVPVPGKASSSAIIIFTSASVATPLVDAAGAYTAKLRVSSTFNQSYGILDQLMYTPPKDVAVEINIIQFSIAELVGNRKILPMLVNLSTKP